MTPLDAVDLEGDDLAWTDHAIAGSEVPARLSMLHADAERQTRTVLVRFPDGWRRDAVGHQPAGEEMVILSGALSISGHTANAGEFLVVEPRATRSATSVADGTSALIFFSGAGGGWADGAADDAGSIEVLTLGTGLVRDDRPAMPGTVSVLDTSDGASFDGPVDLVWTDARRWAHVPAGVAVPDVPGPVVVRAWG